MRKRLQLICLALALLLTMSMGACSKKPSFLNESDTSTDSTLEDSTSEDSNTIAESGESTTALESGQSMTASNSDGSKTSSTQKGGIIGQPTTGATTGKFVKPTYDLKGRELVIWGNTAPKSSDLMYQSWKEVEAEYNCKLKFSKVSYSVAVSKMTAAALSGTSECDIWNAQWYDTFPSFVAKGMAAPLSDYYTFSQDPNWVDMGGNVNNYWNGKLYGINDGAAGPGWGLWYNKALLRAANLEDPAELVAKGQWTWDKFLEMCQRLTNKETGKWGYYDEYLFVNSILTNGGELIDINSKNGPTFTMNSEATKYAMRWAIDLVNKYKVVPSIGAIGDPDLLEMFPKGNVAFTTYNSGYGPVCVSKGMNVSDLGYTYFPKGPNATDYVLHAATLSPVYLVPPQVKDPQAVVCVLQDYLCVWDKSESFSVTRSDLLDIGFSGTEYKTIYSNNKDFMLNGGKKNKPSYVNNFFIGETLNTGLFYPLIKGEVDVETGVKKVSANVQTKIDEMVMQSLS